MGRTRQGPEQVRPAWRYEYELNGTAAVCAAQLPGAYMVWWAGTSSDDDYGAGFNSLGLAYLLLFAPLYVPVLGLLHAAVQIAPAAALARLVARRVRGPAWLWHLVCATALGVAWAAPAAVLWDWSFTATAQTLVAFGVLPVFGVAHLRTRPPGRAGVRTRPPLPAHRCSMNR